MTYKFKRTKNVSKKYNSMRLLVFSFILASISLTAQNFPGGVTGAEVWYIGDWDDVDTGVYENSAQTDIAITPIEGTHEKDLFNFNPSIYSKEGIITYVAPLENATGRNVFFVGEPVATNKAFSHIASDWESSPLVFEKSIIRNFFNFNTTNLSANEIAADYGSNENAHINFYHTSHYNIDKKFKSYGQEGETAFHIGKTTEINLGEEMEDEDFVGSFPEFISFPRELSRNERNRVDSYLALKYGITLSGNTSYLNSRNLIFWDASNNNIFSNRIFGFGRDNISGLNQLQSESTHHKEHLVSAVGDIVETNVEKQGLTTIRNNHFLVFGDNGLNATFTNENNDQVKFWPKVWLAQRTGELTDTYPIYFKLYLSSYVIQYLTDNPDDKLWLLKDKHIGNDEVSDFNNDNVNYYSGEINLEEGVAIFKDVFFDSDKSVYDQFTFGAGPEMIVLAQVSGCEGDELKATIDITGGVPEYHITVDSTQGTIEADTNEPSYVVDVDNNTTYTVTVEDVEGLVTELEFTTAAWDFTLDLGPDQSFSGFTQSILLDAGQNITDPEATYAWYEDNTLLQETNSILTVTEPGIYKAVVTSGDRACVVEDEIEISSTDILVNVEIIEACDALHNSLAIKVVGGVAPISITLSGINGDVNYVYDNSDNTIYIITDIDYGTYTITIVDDSGNTVTDTINFTEPTGGLGLDIYASLENYCDGGVACVDYTNPQLPVFNYTFGNSIVIDASNEVTNPNVTYQWFKDDVPYFNGNGPIITIDCINSSKEKDKFTVVATDPITNCTQSQSFAPDFICPENGNNLIAGNSQQGNQEESILDSKVILETKVYPNPAEANTTFTYKVFSTEKFEGIVKLFTIGGAQLYEKQIDGSSNYKVPFNLKTSGTYIIITTTTNGTVATDRVIIK